MATLTRDHSRQVGTIVRQYDRKVGRRAKMTMHAETSVSFATFAKNHNAMIARRSQSATRAGA